MANNSLNPISRLLDIDFPEIKRSNWNNSYDHATTSGVGFVKPVFVDHIMAGTRAQLDFNSASFANSTIAPLYGRYKVKYLAFWAPDRLYMPDWLSGEKMDDDNYPYPYFNTPVRGVVPMTSKEGINVLSPNLDTFIDSTGANGLYVPPTSLASYLRYYPAFAHTKTFVENDNYPNKNAFAFLAFWDAYRTFIYNPQEGSFPIRTKSYMPAFVYTIDGNNYSTHPDSMPEDTIVPIEKLDDFFKAVKRASSAPDIGSLWMDNIPTGHPLWSEKYVYLINPDSVGVDDVVLNNNYHYMLPLCTYKPDLFNSFISNENVELERRKSTVTMDVQGSTASFTMEQWYLASRIQSKIRKNLYKFQDFSQWIDTNFGVKPSTTLTQPMFLGAFESDIIFNDVISTVQQGSSESNSLGSNKDLGSRAAFGTGRNGNNANFFDFTSKEPGTVMILQMIVPETFYFEGCDTIHDNLNFNEEFNPIFDALGFQDMQKQTLNAVPNLDVDPMGRFINSGVLAPPYRREFSVYNSALAQQPYGMEHMGKVNILSGQMVEPNYYQSWTLARSFNYIRGNVKSESIPNNNNILSMPYSTYVVPEMFNNIFANGIRNDNFQFYLSFEYKKYQPVSKQFLSFR